MYCEQTISFMLGRITIDPQIILNFANGLLEFVKTSNIDNFMRLLAIAELDFSLILKDEIYLDEVNEVLSNEINYAQIFCWMNKWYCLDCPTALQEEGLTNISQVVGGLVFPIFYNKHCDVLYRFGGYSNAPEEITEVAQIKDSFGEYSDVNSYIVKGYDMEFSIYLYNDSSTEDDFYCFESSGAYYIHKAVRYDINLTEGYSITRNECLVLCKEDEVIATN